MVTIYFGVDYYPEHWPQKRWAKDVQLMKEAGINLVRIAEFGWSTIEPEEGSYDFSLYDEIIDLLAQHDIEVVLGTPTATPPAWLIEKHPDILQVNKEGQNNHFGGRRHYCFNNPHYREYTKQIVTKLVEHYTDHDHVIGWQIDNEFGHEGSDKCYCEDCQRSFQTWLKEKYGTLEELNQRWGTVFWSQKYSSWQQIPVPKKTWTAHNPSLLLDFHRFSSDSMVEYQQIQVDIIREITDQQWVTHNLPALGNSLNAADLAQDLDFISYDNYPVWGGLPEPVAPEKTAFSHDLMYGLKNQPYWIMEELIGAQGWDQIGYLPRPNQAKMWTYQALGHGAEAIVYFRWRACRFGTEQFCHGILDHDGKPKRKFAEIEEINQELKELGDDFVTSEQKTKVALYHSFANMWAWQIQPQSTEFDYQQEITKFYRPFFDLNIAVDVRTELEALEQYEVLVLPVLFLTETDKLAPIKEFVEQGGQLILTYRSGVKDRDNIVTADSLPGVFQELAGVEIKEYESLPAGKQNTIAWQEDEYQAGVWADLLTATTAEPLAYYKDNFYADTPAITVNQVGAGRVYYIGCSPEVELLQHIYQEIIEPTTVVPITTPRGVEVISTSGQKNNYLVILNHTNQKQTVTVSKEPKISQFTQAEKINLDSFGVEILTAQL